MEEGSAGGNGGGSAADRGLTDAADQQRRADQGKSCKGCLYYSSLLKSDSRNPLCLGLTRQLEHVPSYIVGESEMEADKEGRGLSNFKYVCIGYSVFLNNKDNNIENQENQAKLPFCAGLELLVDKRTSAELAASPEHNTQEAPIVSQPGEAKAAHASANSLLNKFSRSAGIVASGVGRNLVRVGYSIKNHFEDMLYDRRRPK